MFGCCSRASAPPPSAAQAGRPRITEHREDDDDDACCLNCPSCGKPLDKVLDLPYGYWQWTGEGYRLRSPSARVDLSPWTCAACLAELRPFRPQDFDGRTVEPDPAWAVCEGRGCPLTSRRLAGVGCSIWDQLCTTCGTTLWRPAGGDESVCPRCDLAMKVICPRTRKLEAQPIES